MPPFISPYISSPHTYRSRKIQQEPANEAPSGNLIFITRPAVRPYSGEELYTRFMLVATPHILWRNHLPRICVSSSTIVVEETSIEAVQGHFGLLTKGAVILTEEEYLRDLLRGNLSETMTHIQ